MRPGLISGAIAVAVSALGCLLLASGALAVGESTGPPRSLVRAPTPDATDAAHPSRAVGALDDVRAPAIVDGVPVTSGLDWVVYVEVYSDFGIIACSGSLIGEQWIVTAAHCVTDTDPANEFPDGFLLPNLEIFAVIGLKTIAGEIPTSFVYTADENDVFGYPDDFDPFTLAYDIALIRLDRPVPGSVQAIQLLRQEDVRFLAAPGTLGTVAGWGAPSDGPLLATTMSIIPDIDCIATYGIFDALTQLCARDTTDVSSGCYGDSGSPLTVPALPAVALLAGSLSFGEESCARGAPHGFARIAAFTADLVLTLEQDLEAGIGMSTATTRRARAVRRKSAVVRGDVFPAGLATSAIVEWGRTKRYGNIVAGYAGAGFEHFEFSLRLRGLKPGKTYHYRVAAWNGAGWVVGKDRKFTTQATRR